MSYRTSYPVRMFLCMTLIGRLMIGYSHYSQIADAVLAFRKTTNGHIQPNKVLSPLIRLESEPNTKTGLYDKDIDTTNYVAATKPNEHNPANKQQPNDVTDNETSPGKSKPLASRNGSTPPRNRSKLTKMNLQQPKIHKSKLNTRFDVPQQPDEVYAVPDLETLRLEPEERKLPTFVLLVTYARSGSTWLGSITSKAENSMYVYEPLHNILKQTYYKINEVCSFKDICRKPTKLTEKHEFAITVFYRLFTCQFRKLHIEALKNFMTRSLRTTSMKSSVHSCIKSNNYTHCLRELEEKCLQTNHRIIKTVRVSMELAHIMLGLWPNLKILHLSRDPRGITNSRQNSKFSFSYSRSIYTHSRALCSLMFNDTNYDKIIGDTFPGRSKILLYEALAERPIEGAKYIYDFIDAKLSETTLKWVHDSSYADVKKEAYFGINRSNSSQSAYRWRNELKLSSVQIIDATCKNVYERLGFLPLNTMDELKSFDTPSRITPTHIDGFVG